MTTRKTDGSRRPYELGKRLEQMDESRAAILRAARAQLEAHGYKQLTMSTLAAESRVTRQTVHNLFGTKAAVLEALFDLIALEGGMERMREAMTQPSPEGMLERFVEVFCGFWSANRLLLRRIHGIGAIDPEFGGVIDARNRRRLGAATRIAGRFCAAGEVDEKASVLAALTSFEFFDALSQGTVDGQRAQEIIHDLTRKLLVSAPGTAQANPAGSPNRL